MTVEPELDPGKNLAEPQDPKQHKINAELKHRQPKYPANVDISAGLGYWYALALFPVLRSRSRWSGNF
jgi:hypothetical protein